MASKPWLDIKRKTWFMKYRPDPDGSWIRIALCKHEGKIHPDKARNKIPADGEENRREFEKIEYRAKHGLAPPKSPDLPLDAHLRGYVDSRSLSAAATTLLQLRRWCTAFTRFAEGKGVTTLQGVTMTLCREYLEERAGKFAFNSVRTERGYLIGAWSRAVREGLITSNPWTGVRTPGRGGPSTITFWSPEEVAQIAAGCDREWLRDLVDLMASTGLRVSTALLGRWDWVTDGPGTLTIPEMPRVKTAYVHVLGKAALGILRRRKEAVGPSPLFFPRAKGVGMDVASYAHARDGLRAAIRTTGVRSGTCHDFRHSYARQLIELGVPVPIVSRQLGHTTLAMTQRYVSADETMVRKFIDRIEDVMPSSGHPRGT